MREGRPVGRGRDRVHQGAGGRSQVTRDQPDSRGDRGHDRGQQRTLTTRKRSLRDLSQDADADGSGSVDFTEFVELMIKREAEKETPEDLKQAFRVFDKVV